MLAQATGDQGTAGSVSCSILFVWAPTASAARSETHPSSHFHLLSLSIPLHTFKVADAQRRAKLSTITARCPMKLPSPRSNRQRSLQHYSNFSKHLHQSSHHRHPMTRTRLWLLLILLIRLLQPNQQDLHGCLNLSPRQVKRHPCAKVAKILVLLPPRQYCPHLHSLSPIVT